MLLKFSSLSALSVNLPHLLEFFLNNTNRTFLALTSRFLKGLNKNILSPVGIELTTLTITGLEVWCLSSSAYPALLICHVLPVLDN